MVTRIRRSIGLSSGFHAWRGAALSLALGAGLAGTPENRALAGGTAENAMIVIDPSSAESLYAGHYYKNARNIPDANVLYMDPDSANYSAFVDVALKGFMGELDQRRTLDHIDYVVVTPGNSFYVSAPGLVSDGCSPVNRFAMSSCFSMAFIGSDILANPTSGLSNRYYSTATGTPHGFESSLAWFGGNPSTATNSRRYFIGAMLGYTGVLGNALSEVLAMVDRSVAADGSRPAGTFYMMNNTADFARNVRSSQFSATATALAGLGATSQTIAGAALPLGHHDILGCVTGFASDNVDVADMTLIPGSYADHLTSFGATFDNASQTRISEWIRKGASGSAGTVEEPCNYTGKFTNARFHAFFYQGMSLGESYFRTSAYVPFQSLLYGDPLTRTFAYIPVVNVSGLPTQPVSGSFTLVPSATTSRPATSINRHELFIDGVFQRVVNNGGQFNVNTVRMNDGWHDVTILSYDNTLQKTAGRLAAGFFTNNFGHSVSLAAVDTIGSLATNYRFDVTAGSDADEVRLLLNGRVVGSRTGSGPVFVKGQCLGAGHIRLVAEVDYTDGRTARSAPANIEIVYAPGVPTAQAPTAFSFTKTVYNSDPFVLELPASFDTDVTGATFTIVSGPTQATMSSGTRAFRVVTPIGTPCGTDTVVFNATTPNGTSANATITIRYVRPFESCPPDYDHDGFLTGVDFDLFVSAFESGDPGADYNNDCFVNGADFDQFTRDFESGC